MKTEETVFVAIITGVVACMIGIGIGMTMGIDRTKRIAVKNGAAVWGINELSSAPKIVWLGPRLQPEGTKTRVFEIAKEDIIREFISKCLIREPTPELKEQFKKILETLDGELEGVE